MASERTVAQRIADDLFVNGEGKQASHLRLYAGDRYLGGWGRLPAEDRIASVLAASLAWLDFPHAMEAKRLREALVSAPHAEHCRRSMDELRDALSDLPLEERRPGDDDYRCSCYKQELSTPAPDPHPVEALVEEWRARAAALRESSFEEDAATRSIDEAIAKIIEALADQLDAALSGKTGGEHGA